MIRTAFILFLLIDLSPVETTGDKWETFDFIVEKGGKEALRLDVGPKPVKFITPDKTQCGVRSVNAAPYGLFVVPTKTTTKIGIWSKDDFRKPDLQYQLHLHGDKIPKSDNARTHSLGDYLGLGGVYILDKTYPYNDEDFYLFHADYRQSLYSQAITNGHLGESYEIGYETIQIGKSGLDKMLNGRNISFFFACERGCAGSGGWRISDHKGQHRYFSLETVLANFKTDGEFNKKIEHCRKQRSNRF